MRITAPNPDGKPNLVVIQQPMSLNGDVHFTAKEMESLMHGNVPDMKPTDYGKGRWKAAEVPTLSGKPSVMQSGFTQEKSAKTSKSKK